MRVPVVHYDDLDINKNILLDLPFREGSGIITQDIAKLHHPITMVNTPTWTALASGLMTLTLNGTNQYLQCAAASCVDLNFTSGDYSIIGLISWSNSAEDSQIVIGRYKVSYDGWEVYLTESGASRYLSLRHHHASGASLRTGAYSLGWTYDTNWVYGITRTGSTAQFYKNGVAIATVSDVLIDPETCDDDLVIGVRFTKDSNYLKNTLGWHRVFGEALTPRQHMIAYTQIKRWL